MLDEGLLRSFHDMYGLDYVALRYFNVYGPRMDIHGVYTEVLVRWMERIAAGLPPVILGDGSQTMDFVDVGDIARANILAARSDVTDEVFNVASGQETSLHELAHALLDRHGLRPRRSSTGRSVTPTAWLAVSPTSRRPGAAGLQDRDRADRRAAGPGRLVAGRAGSRGHVNRREPAPSGPLVVLCASTPWNGPWLLDQHVATRLSRRARVLYVDPPVSRLTARRDPAAAARWREPALRALGPGLALLTPQGPAAQGAARA